MLSSTTPAPAADDLPDEPAHVVAEHGPRPGHPTIYLDDGPVLDDPDED